MSLTWKYVWWLNLNAEKQPDCWQLKFMAERALRQYMQDVMDKLSGLPPTHETRRLGMRRIDV